MRPPTTFPSPTRAVVDVLDEHLATYEPNVTVGRNLPDDWTPSSPPHVMVAVDGTPTVKHPVAQWPTIRLVGWSDSPTVSNRVVNSAMGALVTHASFGVVPLNGPVEARDPAHEEAELVAMTCRVVNRSLPLIPAT